MKKEDVSARRTRLFHTPLSVAEQHGKILKETKEGMKPKGFEDYDELESVCNEYKDLSDSGKTTREAVDVVRGIAEQWSFKPYEKGMQLNPGDKVYTVDSNRDIFLAVVGSEPLSAGLRIAASHLDSPCLDLKPNPLYEKAGQALFKTHYYGGIRKYQWLARPLELRGVVPKRDGTLVEISLGADPYDPVLVITDLLPHLADKQNGKKVSEAFEGESLNALASITPTCEDEGGERVKFAVLSHLYDKYGITEEDFFAAELSLVPAQNARDVGFDRSMIGAYGHDDRACAFAALRAVLETEKPVHTAVCALVDKEEIGSEGVSGMKSAHFDMFIRDLCRASGAEIDDCYRNSLAFSGDVTCAYDPNFPDVFDESNCAKIGYGAAIMKYTGSRGKSGASDASAELMGRVRVMLNKAKVVRQYGELGKVDAGGGGTVAKYLAERNIKVVDVGIPVLSMHAPFEVISKEDLYMLIKACKALYHD